MYNILKVFVVIFWLSFFVILFCSCLFLLFLSILLGGTYSFWYVTCYVSQGNLSIVPGWDQPKVYRVSKVTIHAYNTGSYEKEDSNCDMMCTPFALKKALAQETLEPQTEIPIYLGNLYCTWVVSMNSMQGKQGYPFLWLFTQIACVYYSLCVRQTNCGSALLMTSTSASYYEGAQSCILEY